MTRIYCGLLDDFAARHDDGRAITTLEGLNTLLISAALFGDSLLINDGHVLLNRAVAAAVVDRRLSPLRNLVECAFLKILTRNDGKLGSLAEVMADKDITTAQDLLREGTYRTAYRPKLEQWASQLGDDSFARWPRITRDDVLASVARTALSAMAALDKDLAVEAERFQSEVGDSLGKRTAWEDVGRRLLETEQLSGVTFRTLMHAANEVYQYAWGCMLTEFEEPVGVQMRLPRWLGELDLPIGEPTGARKPSVRFFVPQETFATRAVKKRWDLLAKVVTPGSDVHGLKVNFRKTLMRYYTSDDVSDTEMRRVTGDYTRGLSKHFAKTGLTGYGIDTAFAVTGLAVPALVAGPVAPIIVGAAVAVGGITASRTDVAGNFLWKLRAPGQKKWIKELQTPSHDSAVSSFQIDRTGSAAHRKNARPYPR